MRAVVRCNRSATFRAQRPFILSVLASALVVHVAYVMVPTISSALAAVGLALVALALSSTSWPRSEFDTIRTFVTISSAYIALRHSVRMSFHPTPSILLLTPVVALVPWPPTPRCFDPYHSTPSASCACSLTYATALTLGLGSALCLLNIRLHFFREAIATVAGATGGICFLAVASGATSARRIGLDGAAERFAVVVLLSASVLLSDRFPPRAIAMVSTCIVVCFWQRVSTAV